MSHDGPAFYDQAQVFAAYTAHRATPDAPNNTLERPLMLELLGDVRGHDVLDLGCGDGAFGAELLAAGATSYTGVDGSRNMIKRARQTLAGTTGRAHLADLREWGFVRDSCSRVCSRLALHYLPDLTAVFQGVHRALRPGGRLVFSVEHPVVTSCDRAWDGEGLRQEWIVDDYFKTGERRVNWLGSSLIKYHRTLEDHFGALQASGFTVDAVREAAPLRANFHSDSDFARRQRIPLFLLMAGTRI